MVSSIITDILNEELKVWLISEYSFDLLNLLKLTLTLKWFTIFCISAFRTNYRCVCGIFTTTHILLKTCTFGVNYYPENAVKPLNLSLVVVNL